MSDAHFRGLVKLTDWSRLTSHDRYHCRSTRAFQRSRSMQCHLPVQTFSPILSYIVKLFILDTPLMIRSRLKSNFIMILILKTHLAIRIRAAVTLSGYPVPQHRSDLIAIYLFVIYFLK